MTKTVLTYGTFDCLHYGHIELLRRAKELGDHLVVGLSTDAFQKTKGKAPTRYSFEERRQMLYQLRSVDAVFSEENWSQKLHDIQYYTADILVMGEDWKGTFDNMPCNVIYLPRTYGISSTQIRNYKEK